MSTTLRDAVITLIYATAHHLGSADYENVNDDEHYRSLVSKQVDAIFHVAGEIGFDLATASTAPVGREDTPLARLFRQVDEAHGLPRS